MNVYAICQLRSKGSSYAHRGKCYPQNYRSSLDDTASSSPILDRSQALRNKIVRAKDLKFGKEDQLSRPEVIILLAPQRATDLNNSLDPDLIEQHEDLAPIFSLREKASHLARSIQLSVAPETVNVIRGMLGWFDLNNPKGEIETVNDAIKHSLGVIAFHKTLELWSDPDIEVPRGDLDGAVLEYGKVVGTSKTDLLKIEQAGEEIPAIISATEADENTLQNLQKFEQVHKLGIGCRQLLSNLSKANSYSKIWDTNGLSLESVPSVTVNLDSVLPLLKYVGLWFKVDQSMDQQDWAVIKKSFVEFNQKNFHAETRNTFAQAIEDISQSLFPYILNRIAPPNSFR